MLVVTGASGFLGGAVVARAVEAGERVAAAMRRSVSVPGAQRCELRAYADLDPPEADAVLIHLAEEADIASANERGDDHVRETRETFAALVAKDWRHVVYASSGAIYGDQVTSAHCEDDPTVGVSSYAQAKLACEALALDAGGSAVRLGNLYGPDMPSRSVIGAILAQLSDTGPLRLRNLSPVRDFVHVADAARGFLLLAGTMSSGIYNLGTGVGTSVGDLARLMLSLAGQSDRPVAETEPDGRVSHLALDPTRLREATGWRPDVPLRTGLAQLIDGTA